MAHIEATTGCSKNNQRSSSLHQGFNRPEKASWPWNLCSKLLNIEFL